MSYLLNYGNYIIKLKNLVVFNNLRFYLFTSSLKIFNLGRYIKILESDSMPLSVNSTSLPKQKNSKIIQRKILQFKFYMKFSKLS